MAFKPLLRTDLDHILAHTEPLWRELANARLFITGGTGFFGKWWLESIAAANDAFDTHISATVLSRNPMRFAEEMPHMAKRQEFEWLMGDVTGFTFPSGNHTHVIHMATAASAELNDAQPLLMLDTIVAGTRRVLDFARHCSAQRLLLTSSGAVYGPQPAAISHIPEDYPGGPDPLSPASAYAEGKRIAELMCALSPEVECVIARCFAFIGPHLPLNAHFAAGNFLRDALNGGPITLQGDGRSVRSYLYAADLIVWLLTLLIRGTPGQAYNVGSDEAITTLELAQRIATQAPGNIEIHVLGAPGNDPAHRYVPNVDHARADLGLPVYLPLDEAIMRTLCWLDAPGIPHEQTC